MTPAVAAMFAAYGALVILSTVLLWVLHRADFLDDPPRAEGPGARNDRARLLNEGRAE